MSGRVRRYRWWLVALGVLLVAGLLLVREEQYESSLSPPPVWIFRIRVGMTEKDVDRLSGATVRPDSFYRRRVPETHIYDHSGYGVTVFFNAEGQVAAVAIDPPDLDERVTWLQRLGLREWNSPDGPSWVQRLGLREWKPPPPGRVRPPSPGFDRPQPGDPPPF